ncbi:MAG: 6-hydroxymethylpterin diphosphokinase MptE-like protein, partial [bacterium]
MQNLWEPNIAAVQKRYPDLAGEVAGIPSTARLFPSQSGVPTGEIAGATGPVLLHSRYDPMKEAAREADAILDGGSAVVVLMGMGLGYTVRDLVERRREGFFDLLVVERDTGVFRAALEAVPLAHAFQDERVHFAIGDRLPLVTETVRKILPGIMSSRLQVFRRNTSVSLYPDYYDQVLEAINHLVEHTTAEFQLMLQSGPRLQENLWRNLPQMVGEAGICRVENLLEDVPAFVVAAGPSLNKNLTQLSQVKDSSVLICVDTAYRLLERAGIEPHLVVATDPSELNERHFQNLSLCGDPILAFDPEVYHTIAAGLPWRRLVVNLDKCATTRWFETRFGPWGCLEKGGSVANTAFSLARHLGCRPIVLVGLDLAYDPRGGASHADGTALARSFDSISQGVSSVTMGRHAATDNPLEESLLWVPGAMGGEV